MNLLPVWNKLKYKTLMEKDGLCCGKSFWLTDNCDVTRWVRSVSRETELTDFCLCRTVSNLLQGLNRARLTRRSAKRATTFNWIQKLNMIGILFTWLFSSNFLLYYFCQPPMSHWSEILCHVYIRVWWPEYQWEPGMGWSWGKAHGCKSLASAKGSKISSLTLVPGYEVQKVVLPINESYVSGSYMY